MTVSELIKLLKKHPKNLRVVYSCHSEYCLLEEGGVKILDLCPPRPDGWVHDKRPDKETETYLVFPGN